MDTRRDVISIIATEGESEETFLQKVKALTRDSFSKRKGSSGFLLRKAGVRPGSHICERDSWEQKIGLCSL